MKRDDHQIIQQVLDGSASTDDFNGFQQRLRDEPGLVKSYGEYALLHHTLCEEFEDQPVTGKRVPVTRWTASAKLAWLAAAAVIVLLAVVFHRKTPAGGMVFPVAAKVRFSADAVWRIDGASRTERESVELGEGTTLHLTQGQVELSAGSATALIEGPSTVTMVSGRSLRLAEGRGHFHVEKSAGMLEVTTPSMSVVDPGTDFGIETHPGGADELHALAGTVGLRVNGRSNGEVLSEGEAARIVGADDVERFPSDGNRFAKDLNRFETILGGPFTRNDWRQDYGNSSISDDHIEGENYAVFHRLVTPVPDDGSSVLLATLEVMAPPNGNFHTDGWAGMSFYNKGNEILFFGDSYGPERTWSLDVKQRLPIILPANPLVGPKTVTLRYDRKTGGVSLHLGSLPLAPAFCSGKIPQGIAFDQIRIGASSDAALAVRSIVIRVGGNSR